jgi:stalled ribosome rescue protein Dom34
VALSISEVKNKENLLKEFFSLADANEKEFEGILSSLIITSPNFTNSIFQKYVKAYCENEITKLLPFELSKLSQISDESLVIQREILEAFLKFSKQDKDEALNFINKIIPGRQ